MYTVNTYEGRVSVRFESESSTTVYADRTVAGFDTEVEARAYASSIEDEVWQEWEKGGTCPVCGYFNTNNDGWCYCGEDE